MDIYETSEYVDGILKNDLGLDLGIGSMKDDVSMDGSHLLKVFMGEGEAKKVEDTIAFLLAKHNDDIDNLIWNSMDSVDKGRFSDSDFKRLLIKQEEQEAKYLNEKDDDKNNKTEPFRTERLLLTPLTFGLREKLAQNIILKEEGPDQGLFLRSLVSSFSDGRLVFAISLIEGKEPIGYIGLWDYDGMIPYGADLIGIVDYYLSTRYRGNGYMKETLSAIVEKNFTKQILKRVRREDKKYCFNVVVNEFVIIKSVVPCDNIAAYKTSLGAGFKEEGKIDVLNRDCQETLEYVLSISKSTYLASH